MYTVRMSRTYVFANLNPNSSTIFFFELKLELNAFLNNLWTFEPLNFYNLKLTNKQTKKFRIRNIGNRSKFIKVIIYSELVISLLLIIVIMQMHDFLFVKIFNI